MTGVGGSVDEDSAGIIIASLLDENTKPVFLKFGYDYGVKSDPITELFSVQTSLDLRKIVPVTKDFVYAEVN